MQKAISKRFIQKEKVEFSLMMRRKITKYVAWWVKRTTESLPTEEMSKYK